LGNRTVYGGGSEEVKEVKEVEEIKEVKECKLLVGGDSKEVPLTEGCGADRLECREGVFLLA
jgi:hypothetical protein